ncbi:MAG: DNA polymerase III subunit alpha, partial [Planctomycetota bacterium]
AYVAPGSRTEKAGGPKESNHHLTLLCRDEAGYANLMALASTAYLDGHHYKPRIDKEVVAERAGGLVALSGCLSGEAAQAAAGGNTDAAREVLERYRDMFAPGDFYVEIQENGIEAQARANAGLVTLARELDLPLVATNDVHYTNQEDSQAHDVLLCIGTGKKRGDENRLRFETDAFYFRTPDEMAELFSELPQSLRATMEIAEKCDLKLETGRFRYPRFAVPEGETEASYLRGLVEAGARERYGAIEGAVKERVDSELGIIERMDFPGYMLIVGDIVRYARENGIAVGPGRGSATGSVVSYCLGITKLDPFKYDLIFERFMNEGRHEMPDIDLDFCQSRREEVIAYVTRKYGREHVAQIITFGTMAARASIRDVGRVLEVPLPVVDQFAKLIPAKPGITLKEALKAEPELGQRAKADPALGELLAIARRLEGLTRNPGKHAAGVVIGDRPLTEYCPVYRQPGTDEIMTQFDMNAVTEIGLLKVDFLGLQTLTMLRRASRLVEERTGERIEPDDLHLDDAKTYALFQRAETKGVFQFESSGMRDLLHGAVPDRLEDLIALNALYRPGAMDDIPTFVDCKHGRTKPPTVDPRVDPILEPTYGVIAYQEQVMRIARVMAGFTLSESDKLRKAMGKKKADLMAKFREKFMAGARERDYAPKTAENIWDRMAKFSGYGFNKSHSAAYAALLTLDMGKTDKVAEYADEARRMGIEILGPDVDEPGVGFMISGDKAVRFGLAAVKGVGEKAVESIVAARAEGGEFRSLVDFCERVDLRLANKSVVQCLVKAGAFDSLGVGRARLFTGVPAALGIGGRAQSDRESGQTSLFGMLEGAASAPAERKADEGLPRAEEWTERERLAKEKSVLGLYVSGHPLRRQEKWLKHYSKADSSTIAKLDDGAEVIVAGLLATVQFRTSQKSGKPWAKLVLEDLKGTVEARVFSSILDEVRTELVAENVVLLAGRVDGAGQSPTVLVDAVIPYAQAPSRLLGRAKVRVPYDELDDELIEDMLVVLKASPGKVEVYFDVKRGSEPDVIISAGDGVRTGPGEQLESDLEALLGPGCLEVFPAREPFQIETKARRRWQGGNGGRNGR